MTAAGDKGPVRLTFTGVDAKTDLDAVIGIGRRNPHVEFAVLVGSRTGKPGANRYPDLGVVRDFRRRAVAAGVRCAIHLWRQLQPGRHEAGV